MSRGSSAGKRRVEDQRKKRKQAKAERRDDRQQAEGADASSHSDLMERFRLVHERHEQHLLSDEAFRSERDEILLALGIEPPDDGGP